MIDGPSRFIIRPYRPDDAPHLRRLYSRLGSPYRPEDGAEVVAMHIRALRAEHVGDSWSPLPPNEPNVDDAAHLAFWVAAAGNEVVGTVGLRQVGEASSVASDSAENSSMPGLRSWIESGSVGEVRRLRVAPEWRRCGLGTALMHELINSATFSFGFRRLVLNTTAAQIPALALYARFGFHELGRSYLGAYELVWLERLLDGVSV
jgi:RimJ/RimL family protein N-acetyltransferase